MPARPAEIGQYVVTRCYRQRLEYALFVQLHEAPINLRSLPSRLEVIGEPPAVGVPTD